MRPALRRVARRGPARLAAVAAHLRGRWSALRRYPAAVAPLGLAVGGAWSVAFWRLCTRGDEVTVLGINDYPLHLQSAQHLSLVPFRVDVPELLFHLLARVAEAVVGERAGPVVALALLTALAYVAVVAVLRQPRSDGVVIAPRIAMAVGVLYFFSETPALVLLAIGVMPPTAPFSTVHWWGNPTFVAAVPFTLLTIVLIGRVVESSIDPERFDDRRGERVGLAVVVILGALAKPAFTVVILPAVPIYLVLVRRAPWATVGRLVAWVVVPGALVAGWQSWYLGTSQSQAFRSGWTFAPIVEPIYGWSKMGLIFWFPLLLPVVAWWASRGAFVRDRSVQLVLVATAISIPLMLCIRETGDKAGEGNMAVPAQACIAALLVLSFRSIVWEVVAPRPGAARRRRAVVVVVSLLGLSLLAGGVMSWLDGAGLVHVPADWELIYQGT